MSMFVKNKISALTMCCVVSFAMFAAFSCFSCVQRDFNANKSLSENATNATVAVFAKSDSLLDRLQINSPESRKAIAEVIEKEFADVAASSEEPAMAMKLAVLFTAKALRAGGDSLCADEEKLSLFRGVNMPLVTKKGELLLPADGIVGTATSLRVVSVAASQGQAGSFALQAKAALDDAVHSPFAWGTLSPMLASVGAEKVIKMRVCPQRAFALTEDAALGARYAIFGAVLPEEIEGVLNATDADGIIPSTIFTCFQSKAATHSSPFFRTALREVLSAHQARSIAFLASQLAGSQTGSFIDFELEMLKSCSCISLVKRANELSSPTTNNPTPQFRESDFCAEPEQY
jgi:hypothetical protein